MSKIKPSWISNVRQLIHWQYAKLIAEARSGKRNEFPIVMSEFKNLESGKKKLSGIIKENKNFLNSSKTCVYCDSDEDIQFDHIIPLSKGGPDTFDNLVYACKKCNQSKGTKSVIEWYGDNYSYEVPSIVMAKYLKLVFEEHRKHGTLESTEYFDNYNNEIVDLADIFNK